MTNPNQQLLDDQIRRRIYLEAFSDEEVKKVRRFLQQLQRDLRGQIAANREAFDGTRAQALRIASQEQLLRSIARLHEDTYNRLESEIDEGFRSLATSQAQFEAQSLGRAVSSAQLVGTIAEVTTLQAITASNARPMNGRLLADWMKGLEPSARERINQAMRISFVEGESLSRAIDRLQQVVGMNYRAAEALARTSHTHIAGAVQEATYQANSDIVERYEWRAVLDSRTTLICASRDGKRYKVGQGPMPPAHIRCRSTTVGILEDFPPPDRETYGQWLKRQPVHVQEAVLGVAKAKAFRDGKFELTDFVKPTGTIKTLKELELKLTPKPAPKNVVKSAPKPDLARYPLPEGSPDPKWLKEQMLKHPGARLSIDGLKKLGVSEDKINDILGHAGVLLPQAKRFLLEKDRKTQKDASEFSEIEVARTLYTFFGTYSRHVKHMRSKGVDPFDAEDAYIINAWTRHGDEWLQHGLRKGPDAFALANSDRLDRAVRNWQIYAARNRVNLMYPNKGFERVFRGEKAYKINSTTTTIDVWDQKEIGDEVDFAGFLATSHDRLTAQSFGANIFFEIISKPRYSISDMSHFGAESEILFPPGTRFRLVSKNRVNSNMIEITLEEIE